MTENTSLEYLQACKMLEWNSADSGITGNKQTIPVAEDVAKFHIHFRIAFKANTLKSFHSTKLIKQLYN